jgi:hypothetical protein
MRLYLSAAESRNELAKRIKQSRGVSVQNDPSRKCRKDANLCRKGVLSYHRLFGVGKAQKRNAA